MPRTNMPAIAIAFAERAQHPVTGNNTLYDPSQGVVRYHGAPIAWWDRHGVPHVCFCGWPTITTNARITAILMALERVGYDVGGYTGAHRFHNRHTRTDRWIEHDGQPIDAGTEFALATRMAAIAVRLAHAFHVEHTRAPYVSRQDDIHQEGVR